jgi:enoyl reductase-like protein
MKNGMTRIEVSKKIYSAKEETDFFKSSNSIKWYSKVVDNFLHSINDPVIKLNHEVPFKTFWDSFFGVEGFKHTLFIH